jgi:hypothetical protein
VISSELKPATFRLVAECLNQLRCCPKNTKFYSYVRTSLSAIGTSSSNSNDKCKQLCRYGVTFLQFFSASRSRQSVEQVDSVGNAADFYARTVKFPRVVCPSNILTILLFTYPSHCQRHSNLTCSSRRSSCVDKSGRGWEVRTIAADCNQI